MHVFMRMGLGYYYYFTAKGWAVKGLNLFSLGSAAFLFSGGFENNKSDVSKVFTAADILRFWLVISDIISIIMTILCVSAVEVVKNE